MMGLIITTFNHSNNICKNWNYNIFQFIINPVGIFKIFFKYYHITHIFDPITGELRKVLGNGINGVGDIPIDKQIKKLKEENSLLYKDIRSMRQSAVKVYNIAKNHMKIPIRNIANEQKKILETDEIVYDYDETNLTKVQILTYLKLKNISLNGEWNGIQRIHLEFSREQSNC